MRAASLCTLFLFLNSQPLFAQSTGTNIPIQQQEAIQKQRESDRREEALRNDALAPNAKSTPTKVDVSTWGLSDTKFEITNHLFGYSTIVQSDQTLQGVKLTGVMNLAYYQTEKKTETGRSQGRFVFGLEFPLIDLTNRINFWSGLGATLGDTKGLYLDAGLDYRIASWFKLQGGANYNSGEFAPQVSLGFVW